VIACALYFVFFFFLLRCLVLRTAFACHLARRGPTPRLPACCVRLLRARAAAAVLFRLLLPLLVVPLPLLAGAAAAAAVKFCVQPTAAAFPLLLPARGQAFAGAGFSSEGAAAYARKKKPRWYVAVRLCALCFGFYARVRVCIRAETFIDTFHFISGAQIAAHGRARALSRAGCQRFRAPAAAHCDLCIGACCLARACGAHRCPFFLCCARSPSPSRAAPRGPLCSAPPPPLLLLAAAPPPALCARAPTPATACAAPSARGPSFW
jgi:hypothetical protein